jgi:TRAP-type C4-dicarboxylate transport system substrate-binding protein
MAMNKAKYEGLAPDLKKVIDANSGMATSGWLGKTQQGNDAIGRKAAVDRGNTIHTLALAEAQAFVRLSSQISYEWVTDWTSAGSTARSCCRAHAT